MKWHASLFFSAEFGTTNNYYFDTHKPKRQLAHAHNGKRNEKWLISDEVCLK